MTLPPVPVPSRALNRRHLLFIEEYLVELNATKAAAHAGYSGNSASQLGHRLLKDPRIQAAIAERMKEREKHSRIKAYKLLEELAIVNQSSLEHYDIDVAGNVTAKPDAPAGAMRAVSKIRRKTRIIPQKQPVGEAPLEPIIEHDVELSLWDKNPALANGLRHLGLLKDVVEHRDLTLEDIIRAAAGKPGVGGAE